VGYGAETKGYRLYDPERAKVFYSRDVLFNESSHDIEKEQSDLGEKRYVEFNYSSDDEVPTEDTVTDEATEPVLRRSGRERRRPDYYREQAKIANGQLMEPTTVEEALASTQYRQGKMVGCNGERNGISPWK